ncbi:MAG: hypothetical protein JEY79_11840 [Pseudodesulfovibrio sp.]|nr:hypothetical protein [Pseudodesulfovibrio sp.]
MNYKHIPQDPKDNLLPGIKFKTKARKKYERAMWPTMRQDQHTLIPVEDIAPPQDYCKVGGRVFNVSRMGRWNNETIWAFYRAVWKEKRIVGKPWLEDALLQWQFMASDLWRELFAEEKKVKLSKRFEAFKTKFVEWANNLTPEKEAALLKEIKQLDEDRQWRLIRSLIEAKRYRRRTRNEYPKRPVADDDPFWPAIRDQLKDWCDNMTDEQDGDDFCQFALKLLGSNGMRYYKHFNDGAYWR